MSEARPHILVVEDSDVQALELVAALERAEYRATRAASAEAALELLNTELPDLVIADLHLPTMDGREMTRQLRLNARTRAVPVLMLTSADARTGEREGLESGADAFVAKSRDVQQVLVRIPALIRGRKSAGTLGANFRRAHTYTLDSSATQRLRLQDEISKDGYTVEGGADPGLALAAVRRDNAFDVVIVSLLDVNFDGVAIVKDLAQVRDAVRSARTTPFAIIGIGGRSAGGQDVVKAAFNAGADDVIESASDVDLLRLRLRALVRRLLVQEESLRLDVERTSARQAADQFRLLVDGVTDYAIYMLDPSGKVSTWNSGAERIKGYRAEEVIGKDISIFYTSEDRAAGVPRVALETARRAGRYESEALRVRKTGELFWAHVVIDRIADADGAVLGFAKITRDITERRRAAEELQDARSALMQAQKMEAIGQLTGGIAHDFNNMLAGIIGGLSLIKRRIEAKRYGETAPLIEGALTSANRAASLTSRLLAFGRRQTLDLRSVDVKDVISSLRVLLEKSLGENVTLTFDFADEALLARTDVSHLESALLNLTINARDAMPAGGALVIAAAAHAARAGEPELNQGDYVLVSVSDTGEGMAPEVLEKVFDPFFTTKPIGQGTGLGLSMVYGFAHQSGGDVRISSVEGAGTRVDLYLPRSRDAVDAPEAAAPIVVSGAGERVLVVEDDAQVRLLVREVLSELGYHSVEATNADEALALLREGRAVDLLISDVGLPGLDGRKLADLACELRPGLKILLMTGYAEHAGVRSDFLGTDMDMILKPFALEDLATKIQALIVR